MSIMVNLAASATWVAKIESLPLTASRLAQCQAKILSPVGTPCEPGDVLIQRTRNGVYSVAVLLPNGYPLPTGVSCNNERDWFSMFKHHVRGWLAVSHPARVVRICNSGIQALELQISKGDLSPEQFSKAREQLSRFRAEALDDSTGLAESDLLAGFQAWINGVSAQTGRPLSVLLASLREIIGAVKEEEGASPALLKEEFHRCLDI